MKNTFRISGVILLVLSIQSCKEKPTPPVLTTTAVTSIYYTTATSGGEITNDGGDPIVSRGICWNTTADPTTSNNKSTESAGLGPFTSNITSLTPNTTYFVRAYGINTAGTGYGESVTFTTLQVAVPVLTTTAITPITQTSAVLGGNVTDDKGGPVIERGVCISTITNPTIETSRNKNGTGTGAFESLISYLIFGTKYYVRAYATNSAGTGYGNEISFTVPIGAIEFNPNIAYGSLTDIDGNTYKTILLGGKTWMAENLKTSKYNDGLSIPLVTDKNTWANLITPAYCNYDNDAIAYKNTCGAYYNFFTVSTNKLCPIGWHVPTFTEWMDLGMSNAGTKLKESGTTHWADPSNATNPFGFTAIPSGSRDFDGTFKDIGIVANWWAAAEYNNTSAQGMSLYPGPSGCVPFGFDEKKYGFSVRCLKD